MTDKPQDSYRAMTLVTIIGLERPAIIRKPNGIQCDGCGKQINWDRKDADAELARLEAEGWSIPDRCPQCTEASL